MEILNNMHNALLQKFVFILCTVLPLLFFSLNNLRFAEVINFPTSQIKSKLKFLRAGFLITVYEKK